MKTKINLKLGIFAIADPLPFEGKEVVDGHMATLDFNKQSPIAGLMIECKNKVKRIFRE